MKRLLFLGGLFALALGVAAAVRLWFAERRRRTVFPAVDAPALLNPLRRIVMPSRKTLEEMGIAEGQAVLELGPGPGYFSIEATRLIGPSGRLVCMDIQRAMLDLLGERLRNAGADAGLIVGDGMRLPFREAAFDRAFLVTVLGEIPDIEEALRELRRVLKPGGILGLSETLLDPDYVTEGMLRMMCAETSLEVDSLRRHLHGYVARLRRPAD